MKIYTLTNDNIEQVSRETGKSIYVLRKLYVEAWNNKQVAMLVVEDVHFEFSPEVAELVRTANEKDKWVFESNPLRDYIMAFVHELDRKAGLIR